MLFILHSHSSFAMLLLFVDPFLKIGHIIIILNVAAAVEVISIKSGDNFANNILLRNGEVDWFGKDMGRNSTVL